MTWREYIHNAPHHQRRQVYRQALHHGFTLRQIADAARLSVSTVHHHTGPVPVPQLDDPIPPSEAS